jgi:hypothetical protein
VIAGAAANSEAQEIFLREDGLFATSELSARTAIGPDNRLVIRSTDNLAGEIVVRAAEVVEIEIRYSKQAKTERRSNAIDYIDLISVSLERLADYVRLDFRAPNPPPWDSETEAGRVTADVTVPIGISIDVEATFFDMDVTGPIDALSAPSSLGQFNVNNVTERLDITTANQRVVVDSISGDIGIETSNAPITATNITATSAQAKFRNEGGEIRISGCEGSVNVRCKFGRVSLSRFWPGGESSFIRGTSGPIIIDVEEMSTGQLVVSNRHEDIEISIPDDINAFFSLTVGEEGAIEAANIPFRTDLVQRNRLNLIAGDGEAEISGSVRGRGNIYLRGYKGD